MDIRLSFGRYGYLQIFLSDAAPSTWVPVSDSQYTWTEQNSAVVCRQLGYNPDG